MLRNLLLALAFLCLSATGNAEKPFFRASKEQPYHLSVRAVLFDQQGRIACHHFKEIFGYKLDFVQFLHPPSREKQTAA